MTPEEKVVAIAVLDANIPSSQSVDSNGKYVQVRGYSLTVDGAVYSLHLDEYVMPVGPPDGVGYCRYISRPETGDDDLINFYNDPFGPSPWPSGWNTYRISDRP